jgi:hypothetical protein
METGTLGGEVTLQTPNRPRRERLLAPGRRAVQALIVGPTADAYGTSHLIGEPFVLHELWISVATLTAAPSLHDARVHCVFTPNPGNDAAAVSAGQSLLGDPLNNPGVPCGLTLHLTQLESHWTDGNVYLCIHGYSPSSTNFQAMSAIAILTPITA